MFGDQSFHPSSLVARGTLLRQLQASSVIFNLNFLSDSLPSTWSHSFLTHMNTIVRYHYILEQHKLNEVTIFFLCWPISKDGEKPWMLFSGSCLWGIIEQATHKCCLSPIRRASDSNTFSHILEQEFDPRLDNPINQM